MKKLRKRNKNKLKIEVKLETVHDFFARGKRIAKKLNNKEKIQPTRIISFEDPSDLLNFLAKSKIALIWQVRKKPDSITELARKLHRSRASVNKDVRMLEALGIVKSDYIIHPGHGRYRIVTVTDNKPIKLCVEAII